MLFTVEWSIQAPGLCNEIGTEPTRITITSTYKLRTSLPLTCKWQIEDVTTGQSAVNWVEFSIAEDGDFKPSFCEHPELTRSIARNSVLVRDFFVRKTAKAPKGAPLTIGCYFDDRTQGWPHEKPHQPEDGWPTFTIG
jgi:hypothetical protein